MTTPDGLESLMIMLHGARPDREELRPLFHRVLETRNGEGSLRLLEIIGLLQRSGIDTQLCAELMLEALAALCPPNDSADRAALQKRAFERFSGRDTAPKTPSSAPAGAVRAAAFLSHSGQFRPVDRRPARSWASRSKLPEEQSKETE